MLSMKLPKLRAWWKRASPEMRADLLTTLGSTPNAFRHVISGVRGLSTARAIRIEKALNGAVSRTDMSADCATCEYARRCLKGRK